MKPVVAVFDFDGTLTYRDTLLPFLIHAYGPYSTSCKLTVELPFVFGFALGIIPRQQAKERVLKRFFKGKQLHEIEALGHSFAENSLDKHLRPEGRQRIAWHLSQGHRCILVSASLDVYLKPWAEKMGFHKDRKNNGVYCPFP